MSKLTYNEAISLLNQPQNRVSDTHEVIDVKYIGTFFSSPLRKKMNVKLAFLEAAMFCGGIFDIDLIKGVSKSAKIELYESQSDYGPRTANQVPVILNLVGINKFTRRALIQFNTPDHLSFENRYGDLACTLSAQYIMRDLFGALVVTMRSWDVAFGLPMDLVMFGTLGQLLVNQLGQESLHNVVPHTLIVNAGSFHMYDSTAHLAESSGQLFYRWRIPYGLEVREVQEWFAHAAKSISNGDDLSLFVEHKTIKDVHVPSISFSGVGA